MGGLDLTDEEAGSSVVQSRLDAGGDRRALVRGVNAVCAGWEDSGGAGVLVSTAWSRGGRVHTTIVCQQGYCKLGQTSTHALCPSSDLSLCLG